MSENIQRGTIVKIGPGATHGTYLGVVDHVGENGQPYVIPIDGSSHSPKYIFEQRIVEFDSANLTDGQFQNYARWRDSRGLRGKDAATGEPLPGCE